jgi:hypothetical protein
MEFGIGRLELESIWNALSYHFVLRSCSVHCVNEQVWNKREKQLETSKRIKKNPEAIQSK